MLPFVDCVFGSMIVYLKNYYVWVTSVNNDDRVAVQIGLIKGLED